MDEELIRSIVNRVMGEYEKAPPCGEIPIEVSARHVHLTRADIDTLFGAGYKLTVKRELSQPGQFLCEERVKIATAAGEFENVAILGPEREKTQAEISLSDARALGLDAPINLSGDLSGAGSLAIISESAAVWAQGGVIIAKAHIHMTPQDALRFGVGHNQSVRVRVASARPLTFDDVIIRVSESYRLAMHIDFDEANACAADKGATGCIAGCGDTVKEATKPRPAEVRRGLITEAEARRMCHGGEQRISLGKGAILTPLAKDYFSSKGIEVEFV